MNRTIPLSIDGYSLRNWKMTDKSALEKYANNRKVWQNMRDIFPHPYTEEDAIAWLKDAEKNKRTEFAISSLQEPIGGIGVRLHEGEYRFTAEIGYWLGEPFWGKGIMTAAVNAMTDYAMESFGLVRIFAYVFVWNKGSCRVLEKAGYEQEGFLHKSVLKNGKIIDQYLYAKVK